MFFESVATFFTAALPFSPFSPFSPLTTFSPLTPSSSSSSSSSSIGSSIGLPELCRTDIFSDTGNEIKVIRRIANNVLFVCLRLNERIIFNITWILHVFQHVHAIWIYHYCGFIRFQLRVHGGSIHNGGYIITRWVGIYMYYIA